MNAKERDRKLRKTYYDMIDRCTNPKAVRFPRYGGRGIEVCDRWMASVDFFLADMAEGYGEGLSLDRIDNDGPYSPENCRWATWKEQAENRSTNVYVELYGERMTILEAATRQGLSMTTVHTRIHRHGWSVERALLTPVTKGRRTRVRAGRQKKR